MSLHVARGLALPDDFVTQSCAIVAKRGAGKTYTASVIAEELARLNLPFVCLDPMGVMWGLRSDATGRKPGFEVVVLGGDHGDLPLEPTGGKVVANFIVEHPAAYVIDMSHFESNSAQDRFATDFATTLYRSKGRARTPLHLIVDEADSFAPQRPMPNQTTMLGAFEAIVRRGRSRGLGVTLISQRPAVLNKNVLTQIEVLIAHQITSPQDRSALDEWAKGWSTPTQRSEFLEGLARLKVGEAWIWSPTWLEVFKPITVRRRQTFDSSATPKAGEERTEPKVLADVDLDALKAAMADTVARAQADDPKILRAEIRRLEGELRAAEAIVLEQTEMARQPVPFVPPEVHDAIRVANAVVLNAFDDIGAAVREAATPFNLAMSNALLKIESVSVDTRRREVQPAAPTPRSGEGGSTPVSPSAPGTASARGAARPTPTRTTAVDRAGLDQAARKVLYVLAANGPTLSKRQIALLTGYSVKASTIGNAMSKLRAAEYVDGWTITDDGAAVAAGLTGAGIPPAGGPALLRYWLEHPALDQAARRVLGTLTGPPVRMWSKRDIANATGYSVEASTIGNALSKLRSLGLVDGWQLSREFEDAIR